MNKVWYHGTSPVLLERILKDGKVSAPFYVTTDRGIARWFSWNKVKYHPDPKIRRSRMILELDLSGYDVTPDPDPEAQQGRYRGKCFIVDRDLPSSRIVATTINEATVQQKPGAKDQITPTQYHILNREAASVKQMEGKLSRIPRRLPYAVNEGLRPPKTSAFLKVMWHGSKSKGGTAVGQGNDLGGGIYWADDRDYAEVFGDKIYKAKVSLDKIVAADDRQLAALSQRLTGRRDWRGNNEMFSILKGMGIEGIRHLANDDTENELIDWTRKTGKLLTKVNLQECLPV